MSLQLSIPEPCHEDWNSMTAVERGKFCAACQQKVIDFSKATDAEIIAAIKAENGLCGRFRTDQINRNLKQHNKKYKFPIAASFALVSFLGLGNHEAKAQGKPLMVKQEKKTTATEKPSAIKEIIIKGRVFDDDELPLEGVTIQAVGKKSLTYTDANGLYSITIEPGDELMFTKYGYSEEYSRFKSTGTAPTIYLYQIKNIKSYVLGKIVSVETVYQKPRTFLGRLFHKIGNLFK